MKRLALIMIAMAFMASASHAASKKQQLAASLDSLFSSVYHEGEPGAAVVLLKNGKKVWEHCYGIADIETKAPITPKTNFCIASVSKQFSAVAILQLAEQGKLSLKDNLHKFFPTWKASFYDQITLHHILSHTSGIPDARDRSNLQFKLTATDVESASYMETLDHLNFTPGDGHYEYINPTFQLAYQIVAKASGEDFETYMKRHIFDIAGMKHTQYFAAGRAIENMAHGYDWNEEKKMWEEYDYGEESFFATKADGGIYTSITDFAKWERALRDNKVMSAASKASAYTPKVTIPAEANYGHQQHTGYGYGFFIQSIPGRYPIVYHLGDNGGFKIYAGKIPATDVPLLFFSTRPNIDRLGMVNIIYDRIQELYPEWIVKK